VTYHLCKTKCPQNIKLQALKALAVILLKSDGYRMNLALGQINRNISEDHYVLFVD